jgi:hypothetical protein
MADLENAIQFIRTGQKEEARRILEPLLKTEPNNIQAWFWYVETCAGLETRIQVLEACLKMNPGNFQVIQALHKLRSQRPAPVIPPPMPAPQPSNPSISAPAQNTQNSYAEINAKALDDGPRVRPFYEVWFKVLASLDMETYEDLMKDPQADANRGFAWVALAGVISGFLTPFSFVSNPQFIEIQNTVEYQELFGEMGTGTLILLLAIFFAIVTPIINVVNLTIGAGLQNIAAVMFEGRGNFSRTVYAMAAYFAPMSIVSAAIGTLPIVGQCLAGLLGFYTIFLNVRALRAAHSLSTGQALGAMIAPAILIFLFVCIAAFMLSVGGS